jgi:hypothetical protein
MTSAKPLLMSSICELTARLRFDATSSTKRPSSSSPEVVFDVHTMAFVAVSLRQVGHVERARAIERSYVVVVEDVLCNCPILLFFGKRRFFQYVGIGREPSRRRRSAQRFVVDRAAAQHTASIAHDDAIIIIVVVVECESVAARVVAHR